jgi:hypothetical protein
MDYKKLIEAEGYYVGNLWHISDVQMYFDCTDAEAMEVLDRVFRVFNNEWINEQISDSITTIAESLNLKHKE